MNDDGLGFIEEYEQPSKKGKGRKSPQYQSGMQATHAQVHQATKQEKMVNGRVHKSLLLDPDIIARVEEIIHQENLMKMDGWEWIISQGLRRYEQGMRPEKEVGAQKFRVKR